MTSLSLRSDRRSTPASVFAVVVAVLCVGTVSGARGQTADELLRRADHYRLPQASMQIETEVDTAAADGGSEKSRRYSVFVQGPQRSLVLMQSPAEKGQKVLMLGDDFWLVMPASQRPLRITPMQKLIGDASTGDIATMSWSSDYAAEHVGEDDCDGQRCIHLHLTAMRRGVAYQRIELWIGRLRHEPLKADLYVQSDKLAKQARFLMDKAEAPTVVTEMLLKDQLSNRKETRVRYLERRTREVPDMWLNPMFLARNPRLD